MIFKRCCNWLCSKISSRLFVMNFLVFRLWKIIKNKRVDIFAFCQLENSFKIMIWVWEDFGAKVKKCDFGQKPVCYSPRFWMKNQDFGKKIKMSQNFTSCKTCFLKGFPIDRTWKSRIVYFLWIFYRIGIVGIVSLTSVGMGIVSLASLGMGGFLAWVWALLGLLAWACWHR